MNVMMQSQNIEADKMVVNTYLFGFVAFDKKNDKCLFTWQKVQELIQGLQCKNIVTYSVRSYLRQITPCPTTRVVAMFHECISFQFGGHYAATSITRGPVLH